MAEHQYVFVFETDRSEEEMDELMNLVETMVQQALEWQSLEKGTRRNSMAALASLALAQALQSIED